MKTYEPITPELLERMEAAIRRSMAGVRDPNEMRQAAERMDRIRESIRDRHGELDIGVPALRELRK